MEFILECPPLKRAMVDDLLCILTKKWTTLNLKTTPSSLRSLPLRQPEEGLLTFPPQRVGELNHL